ncbi:glucose/arabinose dehydrogenase [Neolewinella xylanilytica]|uniref:Glucose/arabinose dehydrogenase n=1 Tax=Neolewinella xylanilytica TaxID=1514080 RepID=A0A2S6I842_9BACT|nr:PQQ-dependent sugar dehydrogenase [Neolewinella xylanilytica]PPK87667.1 glucose/arabinose dehydrogenase [Neolewinella xylanilytica]
MIHLIPLRSVRILLSVVVAACWLGCGNDRIDVPPSPYPISPDAFSVDTLAGGFTIPFGVAVVEEDEYYITDRVGQLFHYTAGALKEVNGMPAVATFGTPGLAAILHGGLMDVSLHPAYRDNGLLFASYLDTEGFARVSRFRIEDGRAVAFDTIFSTRQPNWSGNGMRIVWQDSTHFFLNVGNSDFSSAAHPVLYAQDMSSDAGKIHRLLADGSVPPDNPVFPGLTGPTTVWSYGHRDVQGLVYEPLTQTLLGIEHGPKGGDEFNLIKRGGNYGWPLFSYGIDYDGGPVSMITEDSAATFTVLPEHYWTVPTDYGGQALAPACLLQVDESNIADWDGYFLFGSLAYRRLMKYDRATGETFGLDLPGRVRTLAQLPGGDILALVERNDLSQSNGMVLRIGR